MITTSNPVSRPLRVVHLGLGPIGIEAIRLALTRASIEIVGAVDVNPAFSGRDLGEVVDAGRRLGVTVEPDLPGVLERTRPDIVLQTTGSRLAAVLPQIETVLAAGVNLVSTNEELAFPFRRHPEESRRIDLLAKEHGVTALGTGVNPGFAMDSLVLTLTSVCRSVRSVEVTRVLDASTRRGPLQKKIGAGLSREEFDERVARRELGHVGLIESLDFLAEALGFQIETVEEKIEPVIARGPVATAYVTIERGQVTGLHHTAVGTIAGRGVISLDLSMFVGADDPVDEIVIRGEPSIVNRVEGGIAGDAATVGILVNAVPRVIAAESGLLTMADIPAPGCVAGRGSLRPRW